jgi:hypothetical protein
MVLMPTDALPRVVSTLPLVAGSKIRPTSLRVSSRRTVGYYLHVTVYRRRVGDMSAARTGAHEAG